jgi:hypothetical protein
MAETCLMATGISCADCGTDVPSLGSLQMHRLRYHSTTPASPPMSPAPLSGPALAGPPLFGSPTPPPPPAAPDGRPARRGRGTAVLLGVAIAALLAGGAVAATRSGPDAPSTEELTALARQATLTQADFPAGWTADPPDPAEDASDDAEGRALAECLGAPYDDNPETAESSFSKDGVLTATSGFSVARTLEWAQADFATLNDGGAPGCFKKVLGGMLSADKPAGASYDIDVTRLDIAALVPPAAARYAAGFRTAITLHRGDLTVPMTFDTIMIRHDRIEATIGFTSVGTAFPEDLRRSLTAAVANRLEG